MKRNSLALLLVLCSVMLVHGQTIHWIIFADTNGDNGTEVQNSTELLISQFVDRVNDAMQGKGYFPRSYIYTGAGFTEAKCNSVINNLSCGNNDIVVFYYLGHGARATVSENEFDAYAKNHPWPDLRFNGGTERKTYPSLGSIHNKLKAKHARLTITVGMCCNIQHSSHVRHGSASQSQSKRYKVVSKTFARKVQKWFSYSGDVIVSAASPGEPAYGPCDYKGSEVDCFTGAICQVMDGYAISDSDDDITWSGFLRRVSSMCSMNARSLNESQTPYYKTNVYKK